MTKFYPITFSRTMYGWKFLFLCLNILIVNFSFAQGVTRNGKITTTGSEYVDRNGGIGGSFGVDKNGKIVAAVVPLAVGSDHQGGKIFYLFVSGDPGYVEGEVHGLIAATADLAGTPWGCDGTAIAGTQAGIGFGNANTNIIVAGCADAGTAAKLCADLVLNSYSDWYLPSIDELVILGANRAAIGDGMTHPFGHYWSSTQDASGAFNSRYNAKVIYIPDNSNYSISKSNPYGVRPIRSF